MTEHSYFLHPEFKALAYILLGFATVVALGLSAKFGAIVLGGLRSIGRMASLGDAQDSENITKITKEE